MFPRVSEHSIFPFQFFFQCNVQLVPLQVQDYPSTGVSEHWSPWIDNLKDQQGRNRNTSTQLA